MFVSLIKGFATSASLIVAIGAQNAFVIRQGLLKRDLFLTACMCSLIDAILILFGIFGFGQIVTIYPWLLEMTKYFAVIFLFAYGCISFKSAFKQKVLENGHQGFFQSRRKTVLMILALSLLNPHVYLDTVILLGSIATQLPLSEQFYFALGAIGASFLWFFLLCYGSQYLAPFLSSTLAWRVIDVTIALFMWGIAISLLHFFPM